MNNWFDLGWLFFLVALSGWLLAVGAVPLLRGLATKGHAARQPHRVFLLAALPSLMPVALVAGSLLLALAKYVGWLADHCPEHGGANHHAHFCFLHRPALVLGFPEYVTGSMAILLLAVSFIAMLQRQRRSARSLEALTRLTGAHRTVTRVKHDRVFAFTFGIKRPAIYLSSAIKQHLGRRQQRIVLAHEAAHIRSRDAMTSLLLEILLIVHLPWMRRWLRLAWHQAAEERADDRVAGRFGRDAVAETLIRLARVQRGQASPLAALGADPVRRIRRLLAPAGPVGPKWIRGAFEGCLLAGLACALGLIFYHHHAVETVLGYLTGS